MPAKDPRCNKSLLKCLTVCGRINSMTITAKAKREKRKLLTLCLWIASFITTKAKPQAAATDNKAHGASFN
jgi:hypothetical protein